MKDTYCDYCNPPYSTFYVSTNNYTPSEILVSFDVEDDTFLNINVFHNNTSSGEAIYDGSFSTKIKYCPICGRKLGAR